MFDEPTPAPRTTAPAGDGPGFPPSAPRRISRRELLAWLAAAAGAGVAGTSVFAGGSRPVGPRAERTAPAMPPATPDPVARREGGATSLSSGTARWSDLAPAPTDRRLLVVIELAGGNDGLSTVVPAGIAGYHDLRSATRIDDDDVLSIDDEVGLHPNLAGVAALGLSIVEGIGSSAPDGSHFEMFARWWGGHSERVETTGWIGRAADLLHDGSVPTTAISVGSGAHPILRSEAAPTLSLPSLDALWAVAGAPLDDRFLGAFQTGLEALADGAGSGERHRRALGDARSFGERIVARDDSGVDVYDEYGYDWGFGSALHLAATLAVHDAGVRIVHIVMDGDFDTHEGHDWRHPALMADLDRNLVAFHAELDAAGVADRVAVMTVSEFGRTAAENGSRGLDHGTASTALVLGPGTGGRFGRHPSLTSLDEHGDLIATAPFENYLAGTVGHWLGLPADSLFPSATDHLRPFS